MRLFRFAPEGYRFIFVSSLITVIAEVVFIEKWKSGNYDVTFFLLVTLFCLSLGITIFMAIFFRDPERKVPKGDGIFVSPADGKVILIKDVYEGDYLKTDTREISIFMPLYVVHVNRAPCDGTVDVIKHSPGKFLVAYEEMASVENENVAMVLRGNKGRILVRQVAGFIARRIVCRVKVGDVLKCGERYGMIKFGSRLDVYLPKDTKIKVTLGERVKAGVTVIGEL